MVAADEIAAMAGSENKPTTLVSWFDAARFCNWMQNRQGAGSTETGASFLASSLCGDCGPSYELDLEGFRVASVPEPSFLALTILASGVLVTRSKR